MRGIAHQHGDMAGLDCADIRFHDRYPPTLASWLIVPLSWLQLPFNEIGSPQVRHDLHGYAKQRFVIGFACLAVFLQRPHGIARRLRNDPAVWQLESQALGVDRKIIAHCIHHQLAPARVELVDPCVRHAATHFDQHIELLECLLLVNPGDWRVRHEPGAVFGIAISATHDGCLRDVW